MEVMAAPEKPRGKDDETGNGSERESFKDVFKYYKSKNPPPSLKDLVDFRNSESDYILQDFESKKQSYNHSKSFGLTDPSQWKICSVKEKPGLVCIQNPFTTKGQKYWMQKCLKEYPKKPNKTNIDSEIVLADWWSYCNENAANRKTYLKKLRWTTLGYHHDWDNKVYTEKNHSEFPKDLAELCAVIARYLGYETFLAQAAIVNYYHMDSTLSPHTDHSEVNLEAPLISISFGQSAIFLIGGRERIQKPYALLLRSGDIVVMSKESRLSYHAVPKILHADLSPWDDDSDGIERSTKRSKHSVSEDDSDWDNIASYIKHARININVRQVLNQNQKSLSDGSDLT